MLCEVLLAELISSGYWLLLITPFTQGEIALISASVGFMSESATFFEDFVVKH